MVCCHLAEIVGPILALALAMGAQRCSWDFGLLWEYRAKITVDTPPPPAKLTPQAMEDNNAYRLPPHLTRHVQDRLSRHLDRVHGMDQGVGQPDGVLHAGREVMEQLGEALEAMVQTMMTAFPECWPESDRRELALKQLGMLEDEA